MIQDCPPVSHLLRNHSLDFSEILYELGIKKLCKMSQVLFDNFHHFDQKPPTQAFLAQNAQKRRFMHFPPNYDPLYSHRTILKFEGFAHSFRKIEFLYNIAFIVKVEIFVLLPYSNWPIFIKNCQNYVRLKWLKIIVYRTFSHNDALNLHNFMYIRFFQNREF